MCGHWRPDLSVQSLPNPTLENVKRTNQAVWRAKQDPGFHVTILAIPISRVTLFAHTDAAPGIATKGGSQAGVFIAAWHPCGGAGGAQRGEALGAEATIAGDTHLGHQGCAFAAGPPVAGFPEQLPGLASGCVQVASDGVGAIAEDRIRHPGSVTFFRPATFSCCDAVC